jgi:hypothetical protein
MTSIAAASGNNYLTPLQQLQAELQSEVNSGAISSSDQTALSSALTDINSSLQGGGAGASASGTNLPPGDLKSKIDNLIASEVSSGKLTSAQATELQGVFKAAFANGPGGKNPAAGAGGPDQAAGSPSAGATHHGHHGHHGAPPASDTSSSTDSTSGSSGAGSAADILQQFLKSLQSALSSSPSASYSASGTPDTSSARTTSASALLIDYQT